MGTYAAPTVFETVAPVSYAAPTLAAAPCSNYAAPTIAAPTFATSTYAAPAYVETVAPVSYSAPTFAAAPTFAGSTFAAPAAGYAAAPITTMTRGTGGIAAPATVGFGGQRFF